MQLLADHGRPGSCSVTVRQATSDAMRLLSDLDTSLVLLVPKLHLGTHFSLEALLPH